MRIPVIAGNWKMNKVVSEGVSFVEAVKESVKDTDVEVILAAPMTLLSDLVKATEGTNVKVSSQNMHFEESGAYTGEVSADMLLDIGVGYTLIGHSERRQYFAETDETVNKKTIRALEKGIVPIVCVGELLEERESGEHENVVKAQVVKALESVSAEDMPKVIVAYEPVWAIGTGKTASSDDANDMIAFVRKTISELYSEEVSEEVRILYGGSVKPANVEELMNKSDIDGALVGGASLQADSFVQLVNF